LKIFKTLSTIKYKKKFVISIISGVLATDPRLVRIPGEMPEKLPGQHRSRSDWAAWLRQHLQVSFYLQYAI
jgi:hypothetical protein